MPRTICKRFHPEPPTISFKENPSMVPPRTLSKEPFHTLRLLTRTHPGGSTKNLLYFNGFHLEHTQEVLPRGILYTKYNFILVWFQFCDHIYCSYYQPNIFHVASVLVHFVKRNKTKVEWKYDLHFVLVFHLLPSASTKKPFIYRWFHQVWIHLGMISNLVSYLF